jgi:hypothetical protein
VTCMDARIDPAAALGIGLGDAHVDPQRRRQRARDSLRSIVLSEQLLGTREIVLLKHTDRGHDGLQERGRARPSWRRASAPAPWPSSARSTSRSFWTPSKPQGRTSSICARHLLFLRMSSSVAGCMMWSRSGKVTKLV